ncbi:ABC transporter ATP-binding protein [Rhodococcus rhodnii]|uniref:ABC transporter ATP-binding protein n=1 Tax=Rhodococcus rhodnii TaxID=38312 RepID=UPI003530D836
MQSGEILLDTRGVTVRFGGHVALDDVSISVRAGTVTGLIGPNGAGKTTLFDTVTGAGRPAAGTVHLAGHDITRLAPHRRARLGMARTFQRLELFVSLTVRQNLLVAADIAGRRSGRRIPSVDEMLELTGLADIADDDVADVPTGRARIVEVARALMSGPRVLLLDEPASGQTEEETARFADLLRQLAAGGLAICLVEHDLPLVMGLCSTVHVLDYGKVIASGPPEQVGADPAVIAAYIGTDHTPGTAATDGDVPDTAREAG